jgi:acetyl-CoA acetyltransferase
MHAQEVVLSHPVRTAIGTFNGTLTATPATDLGAAVVRETLRRSGVDAARIGSVVMGNVIQAGNAPGLSSGAAAMIAAERVVAEQNGLEGIALALAAL